MTLRPLSATPRRIAVKVKRSVEVLGLDAEVGEFLAAPAAGDPAGSVVARCSQYGLLAVPAVAG
jgi:hypothetical protein